jgi:hypothetical protein
MIPPVVCTHSQQAGRPIVPVWSAEAESDAADPERDRGCGPRFIAGCDNNRLFGRDLTQDLT